MNINIQLICILVSFLYGVFIRVLIHINMIINKQNNKIIHIIIDLLFVYIITLLYTIVIYKINNGIFHIYFLALILIGFIASKKCVNFTITRLKYIKKNLIK